MGAPPEQICSDTSFTAPAGTVSDSEKLSCVEHTWTDWRVWAQ